MVLPPGIQQTALKPLEVAAPHLVTFSLEPFPELSHLYILDLFARSASKLTDLKITHVALPDWGTPLLTGLRTLSISRISRHGPSLSQLLDVLHASPALELLRLDSITLKNTSRPVPVNRRIRLPRLTTLELAEVYADATELLGSIDAPSWSYVKVYLERLSDSPLETESLARIYDNFRTFFTPIVTSLTSSGGHLRITLDARVATRFHLRSSDPTLPEVSFALYLSYDDASTPLTWISRLIDHHSPLITTEMMLEGLNESDLLHSLKVLQHLPSITSLQFTIWANAGTVAMLRALSSPTVASADRGTPSWLCPNLHSVSLINCAIPPGVVLDMVEGRMAAVSDEARGTSGVARLRHLKVHGDNKMNAKAWERIRDVLGPEAHCVWQPPGQRG